MKDKNINRKSEIAIAFSYLSLSFVMIAQIPGDIPLMTCVYVIGAILSSIAALCLLFKKISHE